MRLEAICIGALCLGLEFEGLSVADDTDSERFSVRVFAPAQGPSAVGLPGTADYALDPSYNDPSQSFAYLGVADVSWLWRSRKVLGVRPKTSCHRAKI